MVLVDTSVWIRALAGRAPFAAELDRLLNLDEVSGHELVYGELLIGDRGGPAGSVRDDVDHPGWDPRFLSDFGDHEHRRDRGEL